MSEADKNELIEQYLLGQLSGELLYSFEEKLATDEHFRREVALERVIRKNVRTVGRKEWALRLENFHQEMNVTAEEEATVKPLYESVESERSQQKRHLFLAIAAAFVLLLVATVILINTSNKTNPNQIFVAYYQPYTSVEQATRALPNETPSERAKAFEFYNNGNYPESIKIFNRILAQGEEEVVLFYLGNAYLSDNRPNEAEKVFKNYLSKYQEFALEARWYLSLSYLKQDRVVEAKQILEELSKQDNNYRTEAIEILKSLKPAS